jgi:hypothetical protein|tara:strand:+ start:601 stop:834 length:234 start_codon:yes stop_codon:yes gene_type:complete
MSKFKEFKEQGDLFRPRPEWKRRGFKSREEYRKALEFDRAWRHMEQSNMTRLRKKYLRERKPNLFRSLVRKMREVFK